MAIGDRGSLDLGPWVNLSSPFSLGPSPFLLRSPTCPLFVAYCANLCVVTPSANLSRTSFIASFIASFITSLPSPTRLSSSLAYPPPPASLHRFLRRFIRRYRVGNGPTYDQTEPMGRPTTDDRVPRHLAADGARDGTAGEPNLFGVARLSVFIYVFTYLRIYVFECFWAWYGGCLAGVGPYASV